MDEQQSKYRGGTFRCSGLWAIPPVLVGIWNKRGQSCVSARLSTRASGHALRGVCWEEAVGQREGCFGGQGTQGVLAWRSVRA